MNIVQTVIASITMLLCIVLAGFFSGVETGMLSLSRARLMHWAHSGVKPARKLLKFLNRLPRTLATILVGTNLMNVLLSTVSAAFAGSVFTDNPAAQSVWSCFAACAMLYLGEFLPKLLYTTKPLRRTVASIGLFSFFADILSPVTSVVTFITDHLVPERKNQSDRQVVSFDYLKTVVSDRSGTEITQFERSMIERVLSLRNRSVRSVMQPMSATVCVRTTDTLAECFAASAQSGHMRIPVFSADGTRCAGIVNVLDELAHAASPATPVTASRLRPAVSVEAHRAADEVLPLMRASYSPLLVVVDRAHRPVGILTETGLLQLIA